MDRLGDVLELRRAEIVNLEIEPRFDLPIGVVGDANSSGLGDTLQTCSDIDAVAHQVAVALLGHVAYMDGDAKFDPLIGGDLSVALNHRPLDFDGAVDRVDDAPELDNRSVAGALDYPAMIHGDGWIDQIGSERPQPGQNAVLVGSGKARIADDVGHQDRDKLAGLAHRRAQPSSILCRQVLRRDCQTLKQRLRLGDLRHLGCRRETFQRGREDGV